MYMWRFVLITVHAISGEGFQFIFNNEQCTGCGVMITKETKKGHLRDAEDSTKAGTVQETVRGEEIVRASSVPLSVGAQILLHYLSSSADNSYSQRYVRSVFSLTSALMLLNMAHSRVGTGVDTCCCTVSSLPPFLSLSLPLFCPSVLLQVHSITSTSRLSFTYKAATQTLSPTSTGLAFVVSSNRRGSCCDLQSRKSCSATETPHSLLALTNVIINAASYHGDTEGEKINISDGKVKLSLHSMPALWFFFFFLHKYILLWPAVKPENGSFLFWSTAR